MNFFQPSVVVALPVFNEQEGIRSFLSEINSEFLKSNFNYKFVVVDDASTDTSKEILLDMQRTQEFPLVVATRQMNKGHGPSTLEAIDVAIHSGANYVITVDGDGQFLGSDILKLAAALHDSNFDVIEGVRVKRKDPFYRKVTSLATRLLVRSFSGKFPKDANTPLRAYRREVIEVLALRAGNDLLVPNLFFSVLSRISNLRIMELEVLSLERRGSSTRGTMWGSGLKLLPTKKFIVFCLKSLREFRQLTPRKTR